MRFQRLQFKLHLERLWPFRRILHLHADLYVNGTFVDTSYDSFMVYANSSGGGGMAEETIPHLVVTMLTTPTSMHTLLTCSLRINPSTSSL